MDVFGKPLFSRDGDVEDDEYCFREESFSSTGAAVRTDSCPAITSPAIISSGITSTLADSPTSSAPESPSTAAVSLNLLDETNSQISQLSALINDDGTSDSLAAELGGLLDLLNSLAGSLGTFRSFQKSKRAVNDLTCNDLEILMNKYNEVINLVERIIAALNSIGQNTGSEAVNNFIGYSLGVFLAAKPKLESTIKEYEDEADEKNCLTTSTSSTTTAASSTGQPISTETTSTRMTTIASTVQSTQTQTTTPTISLKSTTITSTEKLSTITTTIEATTQDRTVETTTKDSNVETTTQESTLETTTQDSTV